VYYRVLLLPELEREGLGWGRTQTQQKNLFRQKTQKKDKRVTAQKQFGSDLTLRLEFQD
jgi:hypothetical protein